MAEITIKKGNTLGGLAGQYGTTVSDLLKSNPSITNPNLIQAGGKLIVPDATNVGTPSSGTVTAPNLSNTFSTADLTKTPTPTVQTPDPAPAVDPFIASLQASQKQIADLTASYNKPVEQAQADRTTLTERLAKSLESFTGKGAAITAQQKALGVPENIKKLTDLNAQIAQRTGEYDKLSASLEGQGRGLTTGLVTGQQGAVARQKAVEIGALSSVAQALQGNIALAKQTAEDTVNLEFADKEQEIKNLQTLLDLNKDTLTSAEKKQADQVAQTLAERTRLLDQQKQDRKDVLSVAQEAALKGADNTLVTKIAAAKTFAEALSLGAAVLGTEFKNKVQQQKFENDLALKKLAVEAGKSTLKNTEIVKINGVDYQKNADGSYTLPVLPELVPSTEKIEKANGVISKIDALLTNPNLSKAIGPQSVKVPEALRSGDRNAVDADIDSLIANIAIENLSLLKGPMSDKDVQFIKDASAGLKKNVSEPAFKAKLEEIKNKFVEIKNKAEKLPPTSPELGVFMSSLTTQESGGNVNAKNARTGASGLFQILPANWPAWSKEAGVTGGQTAENQIKVAQFKLQQYYNQYGNWRDVASVWYSGKPFSQVVAEGWADRKQGNGSEPSVRQYVDSVVNRMNVATKVAPGEIKVRQKSTGQVGTIPESEFNPNDYDKV